MRRGGAVACAAAAAAALFLPACGTESVPGVGGDDSDTRAGKKIEAVVKRFAAASGPEACDLLTPAALRKVYGAKEKPGPPPELDAPPPAIALAECRRRASEFSGEKVTVERVDLRESGAARVDASSGGGARMFSVSLEQRPSDGAWLIDNIRER